MIDLPLFPLNTVLFPGGTLPLHIFEERYKLMISECMTERSPFGVVLIRSGEEVGGYAQPHDVGTTARVTRVQQLDGGRMNLVAVGVERFRVDALMQDRPYLRARVEILQDLDADNPATQARAEQMTELYRDYYHLALALTDQWQQRIALPERPRALADFVASRVDAAPALKQQLLETLSVGERLDLESRLLEEANSILTMQLIAARRQKYASQTTLN